MFKKSTLIIKKPLVVLIAILLLASVLRVYKVSSLPLGLNIDEVSQGYNAYSLLLTGRDRYGKLFPILFKSYESFQPPLYTYLTVFPMFLFGKTNFSVRFVSITSQLVVVCLTFLIMEKVFSKRKMLSLLSAFVVSISPWSIFFSRYATEASLGLVLILGSIYFLITTERKKLRIITAFLLLGLSTHAYYTEKVVSFLLLFGYTVIDWKLIRDNKKTFIVGFFLFAVLLSPHLYMINKGAFFRRFDQVTYLDSSSFDKFGGKYQGDMFGRFVYIAREFASQYVAYYSPKNLFFIPDSQQGRSVPNLSVFYSWMFVPFLAGIAFLIKEKISKNQKLLLWTMFVSVIPAALSRDAFYTIRTLLFLWFVSLLIGIGIGYFYEKFNRKRTGCLILLIITMLSLFDLHRKYFVMFGYERASAFGGFDKVIADYIKNDEKEVLVDLSERDLATGLRMVYYLDFEPKKFQDEIGYKYLDNYYTGYDVETQYNLGNVQVRPIIWEEDVYKRQLIVGDSISISDSQVLEHKLQLLYEFNFFDGGRSIRVFTTNPLSKCEAGPEMNKDDDKCFHYLE